ncbi:non-ribosomal peptide synthase domain TIGR01720/amino acid adenylation domain-containing protein [Lentzea jiangxiensis]|uniref:Non-ribosomal peptide synthase domain TIGR01720/amino acid adenylation domain-containing protein n=2 Tax=Lentzea jiangxiensis TaxID=641025 RepID=A0A1H0WU58_9PSEU|nr:non-ribosomal peptide synthase domain TIGR01720/amino acid adenylation domain-containing protein [Lentzea jiangxiensis]
MTSHGLSAAQNRFRLAQELSPELPNVVSVVWRIEGTVDAGVLTAQVREALKETPTLRATFHEGAHGALCQEGDLGEWEASAVDLSDAGDPARTARERMRSIVDTRFDLTRGPLLRAELITLSHTAHLLVFACPHLLTDAYGLMRIFSQRVGERYRAACGAEPLSPSGFLPLPDFLRLDAEYRTSSRFVLDGDFWRRYLTTEHEPARPAVASASHVEQQLRHRARQVVPAGMLSSECELPPHQAQVITAAAEEAGVSEQALLAAGIAAFLRGVCGVDDLRIGLSVGNRAGAARGTPGLMSNIVPVNLSIGAGQSLSELARDVATASREVFRHSKHQITDIQRAAGVHGNLRGPFGTIVNIMPPVEDLDLDGGIARFDGGSFGDIDELMISLFRTGAGALHVRLDAPARLHGQSELDHLVTGVRRHLFTLASAPGSAIGTHSSSTLRDLTWLAERNSTRAEVPATTIPALFRDQVAATPGAVAIVADATGTTVTYAELDAMVEKLSQRVREQGVRPESVVAVVLPRSLDLVVALLAVMKAGGTYLPVDPNYPPDRVAYLLADSEPVLVLTTANAEIPADGIRRLNVDEPGDRSEAVHRGESTPGEAENPPAIDDRHPAYVIYTSGSTGAPKGVVVEHRAIVNRLLWMQDEYDLRPVDRVLQKTSASFDVSVWEFFWPLTHGATLVLAEPGGQGDPRYLADVIRREQVTIAHFVPSMFAQFLNDENAAGCSSLRLLVCSGEALPAELVTKAAAVLDASVHNLYGPTEAAVDVTHWRCRPGDRTVPIGTPVWNTGAHVLDSALLPTPVGVVGELYLSGVQLARGYAGRPGLTASRFVASLAGKPGERLYRTGDLARWTDTGTLEYLGRVDRQVKIRGYRVEPGEIEAALTSHPGVAQAAIILTGDATSPRLAAYVVPSGFEGAVRSAIHGVRPIDLRSGLQIAEVRKAAEKLLPSYMVPSTITVLHSLPLTPNGKLDRESLPAPALPVTRSAPPRTHVERVLCEVVAEVLGTAEVGVDDDFFALGGDSIDSISVASRARDRGVHTTPRAIFEARTVARIADGADVRESAPAASRTDSAPYRMPLQPAARFHHDRARGFSRLTQYIVLDAPAETTAAQVRGAVEHLLRDHDILRARLAEDGRALLVPSPADADVGKIFRWVRTTGADRERSQRAELVAARARISLVDGIPLQAVLLDVVDRDRPRILLVAHHLVVDGVSWQVLVAQLAAVASGAPAHRPQTTSVRQWLSGLAGGITRFEAHADHWRNVLATAQSPLGRRYVDPAIDVATTVHERRVLLPPSTTRTLLTLPHAYGGSAQDAVLAALTMAVARFRGAERGGGEPTLIRVEGHGREEHLVPGADLSATVGWFTSFFPILVDITAVDLDDAFASGPAAATAMSAAVEAIAASPDNGIGYGVLRHLSAAAEEWPDESAVQINFNYLGHFDPSSGAAGWNLAAEESPLIATPDPDTPVIAALDVRAVTIGGTPEDAELAVTFAAPEGVLDAPALAEFADEFVRAANAVAHHRPDPRTGIRSAAEVTSALVDRHQLELWEKRFPELADVWPLTSVQSGLLFHSGLAADGFDAYQQQFVLHLTGPVDAERLRNAGQALINRHDALRVAFVPDETGLLMQLVQARVELPWRHHAVRTDQITPWLEADHAEHFDPASAPLLRMTLFTTGPNTADLLITAHHAVFDGWSLPLLLVDLLQLYAGMRLPPAESFKRYLEWLAERDQAAAARAWSTALAGLQSPTMLGDAVPPPATSSSRQVGLGHIDIPIEHDRAHKLVRLASDSQVTLNSVIQLAWGLLLSRLTDSDDVVFGTTVAGRPADLPGAASVVGSFINTIPVRLVCQADARVTELLTYLHTRHAALLDHHHHPLADIQRAAGLGTLFDTLVVFESYPVDRLALDEAARQAGICATGVTPIVGTHYQASLLVTADPLPRMTLQYRRERFDSANAQRLATQLAHVLHDLALVGTEGSTDDISPYDRGERRALLQAYSDTAQPTTGTTVVDHIRNRVHENPAAVAVADGFREVSYLELWKRAQHLAMALRAAGAGPESVVGIALPRTADLVAAVLGVLSAGAAYLPIDVTYPATRIRSIIDSAQPDLIICDPGFAETAQGRPTFTLTDLDRYSTAAEPLSTRAATPLLDNLAYVMSTSGTTGTPKGVAATHRSLVTAVEAMAGWSGVAPGSRLAAGTSISFDISVFELFATLCAGGTLQLLPDTLSLAEIQAQHGIVLSTVPSVLAELLPLIQGKVHAHTVVLGGEPVTAALIRSLREAMPGARVVNTYGPSETFYTTAFVLEHEHEPESEAPLPLGSPLPNVRLYVLDRALRPVPDGCVGELYAGGDTTARGYHHQPALTSSRFVADPFGPPGARLYRTGDLVRRSGDRLDFIARADNQVKIRGFRIETGEIESALTRHPRVQRAVVVPRSSAGGPRLVAYVVTREPADDLISFAGEHLPRHMVPSAVVPISRLPLTPNGKLDRDALPAPDSQSSAYRPPRTRLEHTLAILFAEVLGAASVGIDDDFFEAGGHSLLATRLASRVHTVLGVQLPIREVFDAPTVAKLASRLPTAGVTRPALVARSHTEPVPLSFAQRRLWFLDRLDGPSATYNLPLVVRLRGELDPVALRQALSDLIARHEALRTILVEDEAGTPLQHVVPASEVSFDLPVREADLAEREKAVDELARSPFDIAHEVPIRAVLVRCDADDHTLVVVVHHSAADGGSMPVLGADLSTAYRARLCGRSPAWTPPSVTYRDYTMWQRDLLGRADDPDSMMFRQSEYWRETLAGAPQLVSLPADRPRPPVASHRGASHEFTLPADLVSAMHDLSRRSGTTLSMLVQAAVSLLLHRHGAGSDIVTGAPVAGRTDEALSSMVGLLANTWVLRVGLNDNPTFNDVLDRVRRQALAAYDHQEIPFERLVEVLKPTRSTAQHPLFQVMVAWQSDPWPTLDLPGLHGTVERADTAAAKFDLFISLFPSAGKAIGGVVEYATDLFDFSTVATFVERLERVLRQVCDDPAIRTGAVAVLSAEERRALIQPASATAVSWPPVEVTELVRRQSQASPDATAVSHPASGRTLTYAELDQAAGRLAGWLRRKGTGEGDTVAVALDRSTDLVVALLGVLRSGASYVPIDPSHPRERIELILKDCAPALVLRALPSLENEPDVTESGPSAVHPGRPAYIIYTSGSTGTPKGVEISHGALTNFLLSMRDLLKLDGDDRWLAVTTAAFDIAALELYLPLVVGAQVIIADRDEVADPVRLLSVSEEQQATIVQGTPALWRGLVATTSNGLSRLRVLTGGEALTPSLADALTARAAQVINVYGPTETTIWSTWATVVPGGAPHLGSPIANTGLYVLDEYLNPVVPGAPGDLYLSGDGLAIGYHGRPSLTASAFVADPYGDRGQRMYRTGDRVVRTRDGLIFLGRADRQVKIRGHRVEPGEIETVIVRHPAVRAAAVLAGEDASGTTVLTAYLECDATPTLHDEIVEHLRQRLPGHMVPTRLVPLRELPLTPNGKLDRAALPAAGPPPVAPHRRPQSELERRLCALFAEVLDLPEVGLDDDFFALGGHSLAATLLVARVRDELAVELEVRRIFECPTVGSLTRQWDQLTARRRAPLRRMA